MEPQYNEGPGDWQNLFAIRQGFVISRLIFIYFTINKVKKIVPIYGGRLYIEVRYNNNNNNNNFSCIAVYTKALYRFTIKKKKRK